MTSEELRKSLYFVCEERERLQKEIERLTELCDKYEEEHRTAFKAWLNAIDRNRRAIDKLYCWGEVLNPVFQKEMLNTLEGKE